MNANLSGEKFIEECREQLEVAQEIEFSYNGCKYSIEATRTQTSVNVYETDGRGFEVWKFENGSENGSVIAFSETIDGILNTACFGGKTFIEIQSQIQGE